MHPEIFYTTPQHSKLSLETGSVFSRRRYFSLPSDTIIAYLPTHRQHSMIDIVTIQDRGNKNVCWISHTGSNQRRECSQWDVWVVIYSESLSSFSDCSFSEPMQKAITQVTQSLESFYPKQLV